MSTNRNAASGKRTPAKGCRCPSAARISEMAAKLSSSLGKLHEGTKAIEGHIWLQSAMGGPPRDRPYTVQNDLMLCGLYSAFCDAVWAYLTLCGKRSLRRKQDLADELFKLSPRDFRAWLDHPGRPTPLKNTA